MPTLNLALKVSHSIVSITPDLAMEYLKHNTNKNRNINDKYVTRYAEEMKKGKWHFNGDAIRFDETGQLIDGQHRLNAIVRAGIPVQCLVIKGLPSDAISTVDIGRKRTLGSILKMQYGIEDYYTHKAAVIKGLLIPYTSVPSPLYLNAVNNYSEQQLIDIYFLCSDAIDFSIQSIGGKNSNQIVSSMVTRAFYHENHQALLRFMEVVNNGYANGEHEHAAVALHKYFEELKGRHALSDGSRMEKFEKTQFALNAFLRKKSLKSLKSHTTEMLKKLNPSHFLQWKIPDFDKHLIQKVLEKNSKKVND